MDELTKIAYNCKKATYLIEKQDIGEITLREKLGTKVTIDVKNSESIIGIHCYSREDLMEMVRKLAETFR